MILLLIITCLGILTAFFVGSSLESVEDENQRPPLRMDGFPSAYPERWMFDIRADAPRRIPRIHSDPSALNTAHFIDNLHIDNLLNDSIYQWIYVGEADFIGGFECDLFGSWGEAYSCDEVLTWVDSSWWTSADEPSEPDPSIN